MILIVYRLMVVSAFAFSTSSSMPFVGQDGILGQFSNGEHAILDEAGQDEAWNVFKCSSMSHAKVAIDQNVIYD